MGQASRGITKSPKRRPDGTGYPVLVRLQPDMAKKLDDFRRHQEDLPGRPEAIRRLIEIGLKATKLAGRPSSKTAARAAELAAKVIEHHVKDLPHEEREARKRRVLKGPSPFRGMRNDRT